MKLHSPIKMEEAPETKSELVSVEEGLRNDRNALTLTDNQKRIHTCKQIGGYKKRLGHEREYKFNKQFGTGDLIIEYGANADCDLCPTNPNTIKLYQQEKLIWGDICFKSASLKSGKNLQFVLGNIPEITSLESPDEKKLVWKDRLFWMKYLGKYTSKKPADTLVYCNGVEWIFFRMNEVVEYIISNVEVRYLKTGRIKGDFRDTSKKGVRQYLTFEYRRTHSSYFLGANGSRGFEFIKLLKDNIKHLVIPMEDK